MKNLINRVKQLETKIKTDDILIVQIDDTFVFNGEVFKSENDLKAMYPKINLNKNIIEIE